jgi:pimeloyl-ACP methyl ester carboxylesterase
MPVIRINDINLYYEVQGEGEPVCLIHGLGSSTRDWESQVPAFQQYYRVYRIDLRGHGRSDKPPGDYSIPLLAQDVHDLLEYLKVDHLHLVGISLGGMVALQLALDHPALVRSLVLVNSFVDLPLDTWGRRLNFWKRLWVVRLLGLRKMAEILARNLFPAEGQSALRETFIQRWSENDRQAYLNTLKGMAGWSVRERLPELTAPTLVISADQDYTPVEAKQAYVRLMPAARLEVIANSRHGTPVDQPEVFNRVVLDFLRNPEAAVGR